MNQREEDSDGDLTEINNLEDNVLPIDEGDLKLERDVKNSIIKVRTVVESVLRETSDVGMTRNIVKDAIRLAGYGQKTTVIEQGEPTMNGINETSKQPALRSTNGAMPMTPQSSLDQQFGDLDLEKSDSLSLIDSSALELRDAMKKLLHDKPDYPDRINPVDTERVTAAVKCAEQIGKLLKVKLEAVKLLRNK